VERGKQGIKRSMMVDACGIPRCPSERLGGLPEPVSVHLERGAYDSKPTKELLESLGLVGVISEKGKPTPLGATKRWVVERTNSWQAKLAHKKLL
jgi:hypothetical protein